MQHTLENSLNVSLKKILNLKVVTITLLVLATTSFTSAANLVVSPSGGTYSVGKSFSVDVLVSNNKDNINAVSGELSFPTELLQVTSISKSGSLIGMWAEEPAFSNSDGKATFEGVSLNPGFSGTSGKVVTITFRVKAEGRASVVFKSGSVLANDGNATNVLGTLGSANFTLEESSPVVEPTTPKSTPVVSTDNAIPVISSSSYPDTSKWYSSKEASFTWTLPTGATAVRTLYDEKPSSVPSKVFDPAITNRSFTVEGQGTLYLHVQARTSAGWGAVAHYPFKIDAEGPEKLKVIFTEGTVTTNPTPAVLITAEDSLSGIDRFTVAVDGGAEVSYEVNDSNLYYLPKQSSGKHTAVVTAYDKAGNKDSISVEYTIQVIAVPTITDYSKRVELNEPLTISGATYPQTNIEVVLVNTDGKKYSQGVTSDDKGNFNLAWSEKVDNGVYEMRARVLDQKGGTSEFTDTRVVTVEELALIRIGIFIMNWLSLILILVIAVMAIAATFWYSFIEFARFRKKIRRTLVDVENTLKMNVQALRRDTEEFHTILIKAEKKRELTKEEQAILKKFKKRLEITEQEIEKKLESLG